VTLAACTLLAMPTAMEPAATGVAPAAPVCASTSTGVGVAGAVLASSTT